MKEQQEKKLGKENIFCIFAVMYICIAVVVGFTYKKSGQMEYAYYHNMDNKWTYEDTGEDVDLTNLRKGTESFSIVRSMTHAEQQDTSLCFSTKNIYVKVYCNGSLIYIYHPSAPKLFGKAYGVYLHHMDIPQYPGMADLKIEITPIYEDSANFIRNMAIVNLGVFVRREINSTILSFMGSLIMFIFGLILFYLGLIGVSYGNRRTELLSIGAFAVLAAVYIMTETGILQIFTGSPIQVHFIDYMALALLSYPGVTYAAHVTGNPASRCIIISGIMTVVNVAVQLICTGAGVSDYHEMLIGTHICIGSSVIMIIYLIVKGFTHRAIDHTIYYFLSIAFTFTVFTGLHDLMRYVAHTNQQVDGDTFRIGMFMFILVLGSYEVTVALEMSRKGQKAELMEELAYHDALTGLLNRQAYIQLEKELAERTGGRVYHHSI